MTWTIGDHGFEMTLSHRVPDLIHAKTCVPWLERMSWRGTISDDRRPSPHGPCILAVRAS